MVDSPTLDLFPEELAHRTADGLDVSLLWSRRTNRVTVAVSDACSGDSFRLVVDARHALDAFYHPYAYAASSPESTVSRTSEAAVSA